MDWYCSKMAPPWHLLTLFSSVFSLPFFCKTHSGNRIELDSKAYALKRALIDDLQPAIVSYFMNKDYWEVDEFGFRCPPGNFLHSTSSPAMVKQRRGVMQILKTIQQGPAAELSECAGRLSEQAYICLPGSPQALVPKIPAASKAHGQHVPTCFVGQGQTELDPSVMDPQTKAVFARANSLWKTAKKNPDDPELQLVGVEDLMQGGIANAAANWPTAPKSFQDYMYATAIAAAPAFRAAVSDAIETVEALHAGVQVKHTLIKSCTRFASKTSELMAADGLDDVTAEAKIKDLLRCTATFSTHTLLEEGWANCCAALNVISAKDRRHGPTRDVLLIIALPCGGGGDGGGGGGKGGGAGWSNAPAVGEIQLGYSSVTQLKIFNHIAYGYVRADTSNLDKAGCLSAMLKYDWRALPSCWDDARGYVAGYEAVQPAELALSGMP